MPSASRYFLSFLFLIAELPFLCTALLNLRIAQTESSELCTTASTTDKTFIHCSDTLTIITQKSAGTNAVYTLDFDDEVTNPRTVLTEDKYLLLARSDYIIVVEPDEDGEYEFDEEMKKYDLTYDSSANMVVIGDFLFYKYLYGCVYGVVDWRYPLAVGSLQKQILISENHEQDCSGDFDVYSPGQIVSD